MSDTIIINTNPPVQDSIIINVSPSVSDSINIDTGSTVISVNGKIGVVVLDKCDIGLCNVDDTSDLNKPLSYATISALYLKVDMADFLTLRSLVTSNSANWDSVYSNVLTNSSRWEYAYNTVIGGLSSDLWNNTYTNVQSNSANWNSVYGFVNSTSATNNPTYNLTSFSKLSSQAYILNGNTIQPVLGSNTTSGIYSNVAGGFSNNASESFAGIGGGSDNTASGIYSFVGGGRENEANGECSFVGGGHQNNAFGLGSVVAGGCLNNASGNYSAILGGHNNDSNNIENTFILGSNIVATSANYTYVNNLSSLGVINTSNITFRDGSIQTTAFTNNLDSYVTNTLLQSTSALLTPLTLTRTLTSQLVLNTSINSLTGNWNSAYASTTALNLSSGNWNSVYATVQSNSATTWNYQGTDIKALTGNWQNTYVTVSSLSANWNRSYNTATAYQNISGSFATINFTDSKYLPLTGGTISGPVRVNNNVTIFGNLTATGTTTFANTVFSTTSSLSVVHIGSGPALWVGNNGTGDIASFYDIDQNVEVLHVGGNNGSFPNVGIKTSTPNVDFTVNGQISSNNIIWSVNGNSNQWNSSYNISTSYQNASGSFATNTLLQSTSALLTPLTLTRTLTSQLVKTTDLNSLSATLLTRTDYSSSSATFLQTSIYQNASGSFITAPLGDTRYSKLSSQVYIPGSGVGSIQPVSGNNIASGDYSFIAGGQSNDTNNQANTFILGSNITASEPNYTYVNNLSTNGSLVTGSLSARNNIQTDGQIALGSYTLVNNAPTYVGNVGFGITSAPDTYIFKSTPNGEVNFNGPNSFFGFADRTDYTNSTKDGGFYKYGGVINFWNNVISSNTASIADNGDVHFGVNGYGTYYSNGTTSNIPYPFNVAGAAHFNNSITVGDGTALSLGKAYGQFTSVVGENAGFTINRGDNTSFASLDFLVGASSSTGWSIQSPPGIDDLIIVDRANNVNAVTFKAGGNVGIGTSTPITKLDIKGDGSIGAMRVETGDNSGDAFEAYSIPGYAGFQAYNRNATTTVDMRMVAKDYLFLGGTTGGNATEVVRIKSDGNVGIGTTTPTTKLDVNGVITATGGDSGQWNSAYNISTTYQNASGFFATNTLLQTTSALLTPLTTTEALTSQLVLNTTLNSLSGNWQSSYAWVNSNSAIATFITSISAPSLSGTFYGDGSKLTGIVSPVGIYLPLSGGALTGALTTTSTISSSYTITANNIVAHNQVQYLSAGVVKVYQYYNSLTNSLDTVFN